jgi:hypothetical protein
VPYTSRTTRSARICCAHPRAFAASSPGRTWVHSTSVASTINSSCRWACRSSARRPAEDLLDGRQHRLGVVHGPYPEAEQPVDDERRHFLLDVLAPLLGGQFLESDLATDGLPRSRRSSLVFLHFAGPRVTVARPGRDSHISLCNQNIEVLVQPRGAAQDVIEQRRRSSMNPSLCCIRCNSGQLAGREAPA